MGKDRKRQTKIVKTLLVLLLITLAGCCTTKGMPPQPIKPTLEVWEWVDEEGGMCIDKDNTDKLLKYLKELEQGYK